MKVFRLLTRVIGYELYGGAPFAHPVIPAYFITVLWHAPKYSFTRYVLLKSHEYRALAQFTHTANCSTDRTVPGPQIEIDEFSNDAVHAVCVFYPDRGCPYLFGLASMSEIDWSHRDTRPLAEFEWELGCRKPLTRSHDAMGRHD